MIAKPQMGLALSGGGFRATLFHLGAMWRLNELALLPEIQMISSVSGGSILAGLLAVRWPRLRFQESIAVNFQEEIAEAIWEFCSRDIDLPAALFGLVAGTEKLEESYREHLLGELTLDELPDEPNFIFNAAHIETGRNCTLSKEGLHTWRLGDIATPNLCLAKAVAASSACPPYFPAVILDLNPDDFVKREEYADLFHRDDLKRRMSLTDGGVYDNLGVHAIRDCDTILVSDGSAPLQAKHSAGLTKQFQHRVLRPMEIALEQARAIRRNQLVGNYQSHAKEGCLWYAHTDIRSYKKVRSPFPIRPEWRHYFGEVRTRLNAFSDAEKSLLINWGYIMSDLSIREYYREEAPPPDVLPFEGYRGIDPFTRELVAIPTTEVDPAVRTAQGLS